MIFQDKEPIIFPVFLRACVRVCVCVLKHGQCFKSLCPVKYLNIRRIKFIKCLNHLARYMLVNVVMYTNQSVLFV
jgi:hypothetical protein